MKRLDERDVIAMFQRELGNKKFVPEDVEFFSLGGGRLAFGIDTLVESTDAPPGFAPDKLARKAVVACASDFAAKGIRPRFGLVSVVIPGSYTGKKIRQLARGIAKASAEFGFKILGGDTNKGMELSISVCLIGEASGAARRSGARAGDAVFVTGVFGETAAGLGIIMDGKKAPRAFGARAKRAVFEPTCRLEFGLATKNIMTASTDSSDGLATSLYDIAEQSGKKIVMSAVPASIGVIDYAKCNGLDVLELVLSGGEEYELVFTVRKRDVYKIKNISERLGVPVMQIGRVEAGKGCILDMFEASGIMQDSGWRHFK